MNSFSSGSAKKAPQSRGMSGMLRRLATRRATQMLAAGAMLFVAHNPAQAANDAFALIPVSGNFSGVNWTLGSVIPGAATGTVTSGDSLFFGQSSITTLTNDDTAFNFPMLSFNPGAAAFTIGGNTFTLGSLTSNGIFDNASGVTETITAPFTASGLRIFGVTGGGTLVINSVYSGSGGGISKQNAGTLVLNQQNLYTAGTTVNGGTLTLDFTAAGAPTTNIIAPTSLLTMGGGMLNVLGASAANTQTFAGTTLNPGGNVISVSGGASVALKGLIQNAGTSVVFNGPATINGAGNVAATGVIGTTTLGSTVAGQGGIVGNFGGGATKGADATVGLYDYASTNTTAGTAGTTTGAVGAPIIGGSQVTGFYQTTGLSNSATGTVGVGGNYDYNPTGFNTLGGTNGPITVRFNVAGPDTITFTSGSSQGIQGFLVTPNVGANNVTIAATGAGSGIEFNRSSTGGASDGVIWQNNTQGFLNFTSQINGGRASGSSGNTTQLVQAGPGTVVYSASNFFESGAFLDGGYSEFVADAGLGQLVSAATIQLQGGTIVGGATFTADNAGANKRNLIVGPSGGGLAATAGNTLTIDGTIGSTTLSTENSPLIIGIAASAANGNVAGLLPGSGTGTANTTAVMATGTVFLTGANTFSANTVLDTGTLEINGKNALGGANYGGLTFNGGALQYSPGIGSNGSGDISTAGAGTPLGTNAVTVAAANSAIDLNGNVITYANTIGNGGAGGLSLTSSLSGGILNLNGANTFTGGVTLNSANLTVAANNTTGSATGTGPVAVTVGTLSGSGTASGAVTVGGGNTFGANGPTGGGVINPGVNNVGNLTVGSLTLASGSGAVFGLSGSGTSSTVTVTGSLVNNGVGIDLFIPGTTSPFNATGTYTLFTAGNTGFTGTAGSDGFTSASIQNPYTTGNFVYTFQDTSTAVILMITGTVAVNSNYITDGSGSYMNTANWDHGVPNGVGTTANFGGAAPTHANLNRAVTLDGNVVVGTMTFASPNGESYTLSSGTPTTSTLTFNTGSASAGLLTVASGTHTISAPIVLTTGLTDTVSAGATETLSGGLSGTGPLSVNGAGILALTGSSTYTGGTTISNGTVQINSATSLGDTGATTALSSPSNPVTLEALNSITSSRNFTLAGSNNTIQVDGASVYEIDGTLANGASPGALIVGGTGTLALTSAETYTGGTTINTGSTLQLGVGGTTGTVLNGITDNGTLTFNGNSNPVVSNSISGTGNVIQKGADNVTLSAVNTFSGNTTPTAGTLTVGNTLALQNSTLVYNAGSVLFGPTITAATFGGLTGTSNLALTNTAATPGNVALTISNPAANTYAGALSGGGSLIKANAGVLTLSGANTYTGTTFVSGGSIILTGQLGTTATPTGNVTAGAGSNFTVSGATADLENGVNGISVIASGGTFLQTGGLVNSAGTLSINPSNQSSGSAAIFTGGVANIAAIQTSRTGGTFTGSTPPAGGNINDGVYINGGTLNVSGTVGIANTTGGNSSGTIREDSGNFTVGGTITVSDNNGGRFSLLDINGGTFTSTDTAGGVSVGSAFASTQGEFLVRGTGTANVYVVTLGSASQVGGAVPTSSTVATPVSPVDALTLNGAGATLYVGAGGIVSAVTAPQPGTTVPVNTLVSLVNGTLGATGGGFTTSVPIVLGSATTSPIIQAADSTGAGQPITLTGTLSGVGGMTVTGAGQLTIQNTVANTYSGATRVTTGNLIASSDGALGTSNVTVVNSGTSGGTLTLTGGTTNQYIATTANLILNTPTAGTPFITLGYTGTDTINALYFDGGTTYATPGVYGGVGSGAQFISSDFTGSGTITAAPEPSQFVAFGLGMLGLGGLTLRARRRSAKTTQTA